ncbi:MAG: DUF86 domain-containing protein [Porphyromonadaceae bacterium]|nr:MAG: DUF86 domain-containing protein [Porphyromonadaceae bacterium]
MDNEINTWLYDILQSAKEIESYFDDKAKIFEDYKKDIKTKRAVERNLEIIGEAINRILKKDFTSIRRHINRIDGYGLKLPP